MAGKPCIAIPIPTLHTPEGGEIIDAPVSYCFRSYIDAVRTGGAYPLLIPILPDPNFVPDIAPYFHGLLLPGGADVDPRLYHAHDSDYLERVEADRDAHELAFVRQALALDLPILAICRGHQLLNVACGGTLVQDIAHERPGALAHRNREDPESVYHDITFTPDSALKEWFTRPTIRVNSRHHQAIQTLGAGLVVSATAPDGIIEAIEHPGHEWVVGVQWHPERMIHQAAEQLELFEQFAAAAVRRAAVLGHPV